MIKIAPSILASDFSNLESEIKELDRCKVDWIHLDVMDGNFVPNISFGLPVIKSIRKHTEIAFDAHLMVENPDKFIKDFIDAGADRITVHYEATKHIDRTINLIKGYGRAVGVAINPGTPVGLLEDIVPSLDMVLIMSVNPGFGGQKFIPYALNKIKELREIADAKKPDLLIQIDGGIVRENIKSVVEAGANVIVAGSSIFEKGEIEKNILDLRSRV